MITRVRVERDDAGRPRVVTRTGELAPRVVERGADHLRVALVATVALLLAGDDVTIEVDLAADVHLEIVETAATVAYDMRGGSARWLVHARVAAGGTLVWHGLPLVISDGADVDRRLRLSLAPGATVLLRETVVLGRSGQHGGRLHTGTDVRWADGRPVLVEQLALGQPSPGQPEPGQPEPGRPADPLVLGGARVLDTLTLLGRRIERTGADVLQLAGPGTQVRHLGADLHESPLGVLAASEAERAGAEYFQMKISDGLIAETVRKQ